MFQSVWEYAQKNDGCVYWFNREDERDTGDITVFGKQTDTAIIHAVFDIMVLLWHNSEYTGIALWIDPLLVPVTWSDNVNGITIPVYLLENVAQI